MMKLLILFVSLSAICLHAAPESKKVWIDPGKAAEDDPDFLIQGEYGSEKPANFGLQVIAFGDGKFEAYLLQGGLPGAGWKNGQPRVKLTGSRNDSTIFLKSSVHTHLLIGEIGKDKKTKITNELVTIEIKDEAAHFSLADQEFELPRIVRESPTLDAKPPEDAIVLFDGTSADAWEKGEMDGDLLVNSNPVSKKKFQSYKLHLEFRTPYKPFARGQGRGNSGVYHQGRYETQVLDSFGLEGKDNETGGIYSVSAPIVNACLPPLTWQTYDVDFTAAEWKDGKKVKNARMTVRLNGVLVQDNVEVPKITPAGPVKTESPDPGPIYLQHHGNPVRYRNIWVVEK